MYGEYICVSKQTSVFSYQNFLEHTGCMCTYKRESTTLRRRDRKKARINKIP